MSAPSLPPPSTDSGGHRHRIELWRVVPEGARETVPGGRCPRCTSQRVRRSRTRGPVEVALRAVTPYRAFKCVACRWRGWRFPEAADGPEEDANAAEASTARRLEGRSSRGTSRNRPSLAQLNGRRRRFQFVVSIFLALLVACVFLLNQEATSGAQGEVALPYSP